MLTLYIGEGNGTPHQYSCLENPMDGGAWWATVHGVAEGQTRPSDFTLTFHFHALEKEMATHSSVLAWRIPGTVEPGGLPSVGSHRVGHNWSSSRQTINVYDTKSFANKRIIANLCLRRCFITDYSHSYYQHVLSVCILCLSLPGYPVMMAMAAPLNTPPPQRQVRCFP